MLEQTITRGVQGSWDGSGKLFLWKTEDLRWGDYGFKSTADEAADGQPNPDEQGAGAHNHSATSNKDSLSAMLRTVDFNDFTETEIQVSIPGEITANTSLSKSGSFNPEKILTTSPRRLTQQNVSCIALEPAATAIFLVSISSELPNTVVLNDSLLFWGRITKLILELLARGRFVPSLNTSGSAAFARWQLLTDDPDVTERIVALSAGMPGACMATMGRGVSKKEFISSFIFAVGDALVRTFLRSHSLLTPELGTRARFETVVDFLRSLSSPDGNCKYTASELRQLETSLRRWNSTANANEGKFSAQTIIRLDVPEPKPQQQGALEDTLSGITDEIEKADETEWVLSFFVQIASNRVDPKHIFANDVHLLFEHSAEALEEQLLRDLALAAEDFPPLLRALDKTFPSKIELTTDEAHAFLRTGSIAIAKRGIEVELPEWWGAASSQVGLTLSINSDEATSRGSKTVGLLGTQQLLDFSWEITLGDQTLSPEDFKKLVESRRSLLTINGQWVAINPAHSAAALDFIDRQKREKGLRLIDALRLGFGLANAPQDLPHVKIAASGWIGQLLAADVHNLPRIAAPEEFKGELRPYQSDGLTWLHFLSSLGIGGCLADDMGLGKTIQFLALLLYERKFNSGPPLNPTLLVVPMSILANWEREARRFAPSLKTYLHHGPERMTGRTLLQHCATSDLVITTYNLMARDEAALGQISWGRITLDEAQNIKNLETKQTKAIRKIIELQLSDVTGMGTLPCHRLALTGTPLENRLEELWSIFDFLNPGFLGTVPEFRTKFALPIERDRDKEAAANLNRLIRPFVLRRLKSDPTVINDLPPKIEMEEVVTLTEEQVSLYQATLADMLPQVASASGIHRKGLVLSAITRLKQICNHPSLALKDGASLDGRSVKLQRVEQLLEEMLAEGDKILLFTQFAQMGHLLRPYLAEKFGIDVLFLHGALPKKARDKMVDRFQDPQGPSLFILSLKAGGLGLNLTQANQVIHFDQWWNPAVEEQATDRAYRIGQQRTVQVRRLLCQGTLEEKISALLSRKRELAAEVVGSTRNMVTELSTDELRELLTLTSNFGEH